jgi:chaperonin GroEL
VLAAKTISAKYDTLKESDEFMAGYRIVIDALTAPLKQIAINAGKDDGSVKVYEVQNASGTAAGYDALTDAIIPDMFKAGIIDPVKVTRTALQNAASAAGTFLTTEVAIADAPKKEDNSSAPQMGGGMPGMGGMM